MIHCAGCGNPTFQALEPNHLMTIDELTSVIVMAKDKFDIEGVTYTGGEPTLQQGLPQLTECIHQMGLGVISFTGRRYEEVQDELYGCDMVLDGPFLINQKEERRRLLGSTNQRIICLSDRYADQMHWFSSGKKLTEINLTDTAVFNGDST